MELRSYLTLLKRWAWLLVLGFLIGGAVANVASIYQTPVYQTSTKFMVMGSPEERGTDYYSVYNDIQLARTYSQLIVTEPVMQAASQRLGFPVNGGQVSARQQPDSLIIALTVTDGDPAQAALIANSLVDVFVEYNEALQVSRFASSEESLKAQITQVEGQINALQGEMNQLSQESLKSQKEQVEEQLARLDQQLTQVKGEITALTPPTPAAPEPGVEAAPAAATLDPQTAAVLDEKGRQLEQLQSTYNLYQQVYMNLLVLGETGGSGNQNLRLNQLQTTLALYQQIYSNLLNNYENVRLARLRSTPNVVQLEQARVPTAPIQPQPARNALLGAAAGLLIMGAIAFLIEYLDDTLKTPEDVNRALGLPVIGLIGKMSPAKDKALRVYVADNPRSPIAEAFRTLRTNLEFAAVDQPLQTILVSSSAPGEGKTTVALNLAAAMAQGEKQVVLVDADLRRPAVHRFLKVTNRAGLTDILRSRQRDLSPALRWGEPPVAIITSGALPPNPAELLGSEKMLGLLDELKHRHDLVILDGPPFVVADPVVLSARVDGVLLVVQPGQTKIEAAQAMLEQLQRSGARVLGVVLNGISPNRAHYYGKYRYYSEYYTAQSYGHATGGENGARPRPARAPARKVK